MSCRPIFVLIPTPTTTAAYDYDSTCCTLSNTTAATTINNYDTGNSAINTGKPGGIYSYDSTGHPDYSVKLRVKQWLSEDPIGEQGGINLYGYCQNDPVNLRDELGMFSLSELGGSIWDAVTEPLKNIGSGLWEAAGQTLRLRPDTGIRTLIGTVLSVPSTDAFHEIDGWNDWKDAKGCTFLITVVGVRSDRVASRRLRERVLNLPDYKHIPDSNAGYVYNPEAAVAFGGGVNDVLVQSIPQVLNLSIDNTSQAFARAVRDAFEKAKASKCKNSEICIHVVAHSQGADIVRSALPLLKKEKKQRIHFVGLGGQTRITEEDRVASFRNIRHRYDLVGVQAALTKGGTCEVFENADIGKAAGIDDNPFTFSAHNYNHYIKYLKLNPSSSPSEIILRSLKSLKMSNR